MRISDWSSDVCSSDLLPLDPGRKACAAAPAQAACLDRVDDLLRRLRPRRLQSLPAVMRGIVRHAQRIDDSATRKGEPLLPGKEGQFLDPPQPVRVRAIEHRRHVRSEEHTSELQSLMRISHAVFCLKKKNNIRQNNTTAQ